MYIGPVVVKGLSLTRRSINAREGVDVTTLVCTITVTQTDD